MKSPTYIALQSAIRNIYVVYIIRKVGNKAYLFIQEILQLEALVENF